MHRPPTRRGIQATSDPPRNRLAWRSSALRMLSTAPSAAPRLSGGHTASRAVVPSAARSATATALSPVLIRRHELAAPGAGTAVITSVVVVGGSMPHLTDHGLAIHDLGGGGQIGRASCR